MGSAQIPETGARLAADTPVAADSVAEGRRKPGLAP